MKYLSLLLLVITTCTVSAEPLEMHTKAWFISTVTGPIQGKYKYYFDSSLFLVDDKYKFEEFSASAGAGYEYNKSLLFFLVNTFIVEQEDDGHTAQEYRLWEEANWLALKKPTYVVNSRSRLEERILFGEKQIALRFRQRLMLRKNIPNSSKYKFVVFDEIFLNVNRPNWVAQNLLSQNRAFIGVGITLSKYSSVDIGYMNQYLNGQPKQMSNILYISASINKPIPQLVD